MDDLNRYLEEQLQDPEFRREYIALLRKENAELRDALKPFAVLATDKCWLSVRPDDFAVFDDGKRHKITVGDLRRARAKLKGKE